MPMTRQRWYKQCCLSPGTIQCSKLCLELDCPLSLGVTCIRNPGHINNQ
uniref:Uncharacterized protein n=1 Tax=Arundo donax TaxID=35708 RepID=A0A0A9F171_ARUDO